MSPIFIKISPPKLLVAFAGGCLLSSLATAGLSIGEGGAKCRLLSDYQTSLQPFKSLTPDAALAQILKDTPFYFEHQDWMTRSGKVSSEGESGSLAKVLSGFSEAINASIKQDGCKILVVANDPVGRDEKNEKPETKTSGITEEPALLPDTKKDGSSIADKPDLSAGWHAFLKNDQNLAIDVDWTKKHLYVGEKQTSTAASPVKSAKQEKWSFRAGDKISDVMSIWCKTNGWTLAWDAQEIVAEVDVTVDGQFETVVEMIVDALNRGGAGIRAVFYDANRVLRITEKK